MVHISHQMYPPHVVNRIVQLLLQRLERQRDLTTQAPVVPVRSRRSPRCVDIVGLWDTQLYHCGACVDHGKPRSVRRDCGIRQSPLAAGKGLYPLLVNQRDSEDVLQCLPQGGLCGPKNTVPDFFRGERLGDVLHSTRACTASVYRNSCMACRGYLPTNFAITDAAIFAR